MIFPVTKCKECPFFRQSAIGIVAKYLRAKPGDDMGIAPGDCICPTQLHGATKIDRTALPVEDGRTLPSWCPLRIADVTITISS